MRLPFVSRARFEDALARIDAEREVCQFLRRDLLSSAEQWAALLNKADAKHADLLARYHGLRLQGHAPVAQPVAPKAPNPIASAIARKSGGDPDLRALMEEQAARDAVEGKSEADILMAIQLGQSPTDGTFI